MSDDIRQALIERRIFTDKIRFYVIGLEDTGMNACGCLSLSEAMLLHNATQILCDLLESLKDE